MHPAWPHILSILFAFPNGNAAGDAPVSLRLGTLNVTLGETRLSQVREEIGSGLIDRHGGASWLCYTVSAKAGLQRVWISAGDDGLEAKGFTTEIVTNGEGPSPACPALPDKFTPVSFSNGMWLGMTRTELEQWRSAKSNKLVFEIKDGRAVRLWLTAP